MLLSKLRRVLFRCPLGELRGLSGRLVRSLRMLYFAAREFRHNFCFERAATLAFTTIISLIPLAVLFISVAVQFGVGDRFVEYAKEKWIPLVAPDFRAELSQWLDRNISKDAFSKGTVGLVGFVALVSLVLAALGVVVTAERNLNRLWKVRGTRTYLQKLMVFWVVLTVSPLILGASASVGEYLVPAGGAIARLAQDNLVVRVIYTFLVPVSTGFAAFTVMYYFLPNAGVRMVSAVVGGIMAAILWEASRNSFSLYIGRTSSLYGSLAIFPIFLIWIYINWAIILWGAEVAYAHQNLPLLDGGFSRGPSLRKLPLAFLGVSFLERIAVTFRSGGPPVSASSVAKEKGVGEGEVLDVAKVLVERGVVVEDCQRPGSYVLARDPVCVVLAEVLDALPGEGVPGAAPLAERQVPVRPSDGQGCVPTVTASGLFQEAQSAYRDAFGRRTLADLVAPAPPIDSADPSPRG